MTSNKIEQKERKAVKNILATCSSVRELKPNGEYKDFFDIYYERFSESGFNNIPTIYIQMIQIIIIYKLEQLFLNRNTNNQTYEITTTKIKNVLKEFTTPDEYFYGYINDQHITSIFSQIFPNGIKTMHFKTTVLECAQNYEHLIIFDKYINRQMPKEYYRSFDSISKYIIDTNFMSCASDYIEDSAIPVINIDRNLLIIRDLFSIISSIYSVNIKKR